MNFLFAFLLSIVSLFLILLILVQRGRGGGLTGALGGMGGQSAFGTKAGDAFTRVTVVSATIWIVSAILAVKLLAGRPGPLGDADAAIPLSNNNPAATQTTNPLDGLLPPTSQDSTDAGSQDGPPAGEDIGAAEDAEADPE